MAIENFVEANTISHRLNSQFQRKEFDPHLVEEYCAQVEVEHVKDIDIMWKFNKVPLTVGFEKMVLIPCNIYKIEELFNDSDERLNYNRTKNFLFDIINPADNEEVKENDVIYISYIGVPVSKDGDILIPSGHEPACETFCKTRFFEEDALLGKININMYFRWEVKFSGQVQAIRSSFRNIDRNHLNEMNIIRGNLLPKIGQMTLLHERFET